MVTKVKSGVIGDNTVGITQLNVSDGSDGQVLTTNGSGTLSFTTISAGVDGISSSADANAIFITSAEKIGLGATHDLGANVHIKTADSGVSAVNGNADDLVIENADYTGISILGENETSIFFGDNEDSDVGRIEYFHSSNSMTFRTNASDAMKITSSGNVGIGTSSPNAYSTVTTLTVNGSSQGRLDLEYGGTHGGSLLALSGETQLKAVGASQDMAFEVNNAERMRIDSTSGTTLIKNSVGGEFVAQLTHSNTSAADGSGPAGFQVSFSGVAPNVTNKYFCRMGDTSAFRFIIDSQGNVTNATNSYGQISDERLKENIVDATPKLDELMQLEIKNFNFIGDDKKQLGVIAQQVETIFPNLIDERPDQDPVTNEDLGTTTKSVKYSVFVPMLIKGIQELKTELDAAKARITTLEG